MGHNRQPPQTGDELAHEFKSLGGKINLLKREARDVAARSRQICHELVAYGVSGSPEHNRNDRGRTHGR
jgi:hypothetical protein